MYSTERRQTGDGGRPRDAPSTSPHAYQPTAPRPRSGSYSALPPSPHYHQQGSMPTSPTVSRLPPPPPSPNTRDRGGSAYYDPTSEARSHPREQGMIATPYQARSPIQQREPLYNHYDPSPSRPADAMAPGIKDQAALYPDNREWHSHPPHAHPPPPPPPPAAVDSRSPPRVPQPVRANGTHSHSNSEDNSYASKRSSNPMAMLNLLSDTSSIPAPPPPPPAPRAPSPPRPSAALNPLGHKSTRISSVPDPPPPKEPSKAAARPAPVPEPKKEPLSGLSEAPYKAPAYVPPNAQKGPGPPSLTVRDTERAFNEIEEREESDVEADIPGMEVPRSEYAGRTHKRTLELEITESIKRSKRRKYFQEGLCAQFEADAKAAKVEFLQEHQNEVAEEVRQREIEEDKERKKDQQRKRRREKAIADEEIKRQEDIQAMNATEDPEERAKLEKDIQRREKKIRDTTSRLQGIDPSKEAQNARDEDTPDYHGGGSRGGRGGRGGSRGGAGAGGRARKSKEQKQAEKDSAARAQAFIDQGQELPLIAPKEEERLQGYASRRVDRDDSEPLSDVSPAVFDAPPAAGLQGMARFESKGYNQIYEQISRGMAKDLGRVVRMKNTSLDTKQANARKTAQLASKEARRWQLRTNKSTKDVAARAKRAMREMLGFWKRNERDEREGRKAAERQELDKAKRAEAEREANRQRRKLNFLISQTELYSHFIGKKVKTDEFEKSGVDGDGVAPTAQTVVDTDAPNAIDLPDPSGRLRDKVTNFEDLDFDADDETALQEAAMANAQNAIKEAQDRAREFNRAEGGPDLQGAQDSLDDGEMNFQNPSSLQSMDVAQPKMLDCQLKEYQLKGLNWLVNLYEQGINGILADEMGLGKTVQSISVMAYLAEVHDIWGPFLVIAPASTLHNWQQEITRFVPDIKVLPYWGSAKDRKILRKFWDRKHITYNRDSAFHVLVTSYQLVVMDTAYFQKVKWQYMILDEAQAIKSSSSARWKSLLGFHCRNRLLLTGTPIQNNMQELWALLHFIMPSLFDSHDEFSEWFSKDIENHAQSNTKLNEDQLRRLHMILKPFMLRRIKKHVQKELGDKIEEDVFCDLTYRQRAYYTNLRNKISFFDLIEKAAVGDEQDTATLMNLVMQFRKVCNHPDLFERAEIWSSMSMSYWAETASFMREGHFIPVSYSARSLVEYWLPAMLGSDGGRLDVAGPANDVAGWRKKFLRTDLSIWDERNISESQKGNSAFSWLRFVDQSAGDVAATVRKTQFERAEALATERDWLGGLKVAYDDYGEEEKENAGFTPVHAMLNIVKRNDRRALAEVTNDGYLGKLMNISRDAMDEQGYSVIETCYFPAASAPPVELVCPADRALVEKETTFFNIPIRRALYPVSLNTEAALLQSKLPPSKWPVTNLLPPPASQKQRFTKIQVPSMRRFVTDSGKLARLDQLLRQLKEGGHRVLLYFQMTRMIDLVEEYLTYRNYKYCRLDGSTKLEDRRDTVAAFQSSPDIFVFLLSTRAGGLGINLTSADTVIFYDSDWNPTIDSQAMDRAHRLGQTRQVTVYRLITRNTIEERIRKRALQKEEVQRVVISGQSGSAAAGGDQKVVVDFNNRNRETNRAKEMAMWLADDDQAAAIERREAEVIEEEAKAAAAGPAGTTTGKRKRKAPATAAAKRKEVSMDDMYHEGEGKFEDASHEASGAATPMSAINDDGGPAAKKRKGLSKKAKTVKQRLAVVDGEVG